MSRHGICFQISREDLGQIKLRFDDPYHEAKMLHFELAANNLNGLYKKEFSLFSYQANV
jgi:hypothetical protein